MPLNTPGNYVSTINMALAHWAHVNDALDSPLVLPGGYGITELEADRVAVLDMLTLMETRDNERQIALGTRDRLRTEMMELHGRLRGAFNTLPPGMDHAGAIPNRPQFRAIESRFLKVFRDIGTLWDSVNAAPPVPGFTPPLMVGTLTRAEYEAKMDALAAAYETLDRAVVNLRLARNDRDALLESVKHRLKQYRNAVIAHFGEKHSLVELMPTFGRRASHTRRPPDTTV
jgi:hypothetical protein